MRFSQGLRAGLVLAMLAFTASNVSAEQIQKGRKEALGFVGWQSNNQGKVFGGGLQIGIASRWLFAGEFGYMPVNSYVNGQTYNFNVHYMFPLEHENFTPYVLGGLGFQHFTATFGRASNGTTHAGVNIGGGARWKLGRNWGLRPELKVFLSNNTNARYSIGFFYQF